MKASNFLPGLFATSAPGWLVSFVLHFAVVVGLALATVGTVGSSITAQREFWSLFEAESPGEIEPIHFASPFSEIVTESGEGYFVGDTEKQEFGGHATGSLFTAEIDLGTYSPQSPLATGGSDILTITGRELKDATDVTRVGAQFYGIHAEGNSFVFIVDRSNSMRGEKLLEAKRELLYAIRRLSAEQSFYVIFFAGNSEFMRFAPKNEPEPRPVPATTDNLAKLEHWVADVQPEPWTNPFDAVRFALELAPDAVFLLTDGEFTDKGHTVRYLHNRNFIKLPGEAPRPKVVIHTVGFHSHEGEQTLRKVSSDFGGTYRFVPPPNIVVRRRQG